MRNKTFDILKTICGFEMKRFSYGLKYIIKAFQTFLGSDNTFLTISTMDSIFWNK